MEIQIDCACGVALEVRETDIRFGSTIRLTVEACSDCEAENHAAGVKEDADEAYSRGEESGYNAGHIEGYEKGYAIGHDDGQAEEIKWKEVNDE